MWLGFLIITVAFEDCSACTTTCKLSENVTNIRWNGYNSNHYPHQGNNKPTIVTVQIYIVSIDSVKELSMDYRMEVYLRQIWLDPRLAYNASDGPPYIRYGWSDIPSLWMPDIFLVNSKDASFHYVILPNRLIYIYPDGKVFYSTRLSLVMGCPMTLRMFPFDHQICPIIIETYSHTAKEILLKWENAALRYPSDFNIPQFDLLSIEQADDVHTYDYGWYGTGDRVFSPQGESYPHLNATMKLRRHCGYYITQVYVPSIMIVMMSWVSFWLDIEAIPARISLGLLTVLTLITGTSGVSSHLPKVSYIKALDVWMAACLVFVFAALGEFAVVNVLSRRHHTIRKSDDGNALADNTDLKKTYWWCCKLKVSDSNYMQCRKKAELIDKVCRTLFPVVFVLFNAGYWIVVLLVSNYLQSDDIPHKS